MHHRCGTFSLLQLMRVFDLDAIRAKLDKSKTTGAPRTPADLALWDDFKHQGAYWSVEADGEICTGQA